MSQGFVRKGILSGAVIAAAISAVPNGVDAGLVYDVRFADGTDTKVATGPTSYQVELWARVSGEDTIRSNDAFHLAYITMLSEQVNGGAVTGNLSGDASGFTLAEPWFDAGTRDGLPANLNNDGFGDWGSDSSTATDLGYLFARSTKPTKAGGAYGNAIDASDWEFKLAEWTVNVTDVNASPAAGAETRIAVVQPAFVTGGGQDAYAVFYDDAPTDARGNFIDGGQTSIETSNAAALGVYGDYVTIVAIPEPTSLALVGLTGAGLLARRRRN